MLRARPVDVSKYTQFRKRKSRSAIRIGEADASAGRASARDVRFLAGWDWHVSIVAPVLARGIPAERINRCSAGGDMLLFTLSLAWRACSKESIIADDQNDWGQGLCFLRWQLSRWLSLRTPNPEGIAGFRDAAAEQKLEEKFLAVPEPKLAQEHLRILTAEPHIAGSPEDRKTAEYVARKFREAGLETRIDTYRVWLNLPA